MISKKTQIILGCVSIVFIVFLTLPTPALGYITVTQENHRQGRQNNYTLALECELSISMEVHLQPATGGGYILETILIQNFNSKIKIRKSILKNKEINQKIKTYFLKNFNKIFLSLDNHPFYPLIMRSRSGLKITKKGKDFLRNKGVKIPKEQQEFSTLEVWSEAELANLAQKRGIKIKNI